MASAIIATSNIPTTLAPEMKKPKRATIQTSRRKMTTAAMIKKSIVMTKEHMRRKTKRMRTRWSMKSKRRSTMKNKLITLSAPQRLIKQIKWTHKR
jgi:hypothetical protein